MNKSVIALVVIAVAAGGGLYYANTLAEDAIKQQIEQTNQSYRDLADQGEMPQISLAYKNVSANVLTSSYSISGMEVAVGELGNVATIDLITAKGVKPQSLADKASMQITGIKAAQAALDLLPPHLSDYVKTLVLHGDYSYEYQADGELFFSQQTRINDEFSFNYDVSLAQMQQFWQYAKEFSALSPEQQQALTVSEDYVQQVMSKLTTGALSSGNIVINNKGFIERTIAMAAAQGQSPDFKTIQGMALLNISMLDPLPQSIKESLTTFVNNPEKLKLTFNFDKPLQFEQLASGEPVPGLETPEAMIDYANLKLTAN